MKNGFSKKVIFQRCDNQGFRWLTIFKFQKWNSMTTKKILVNVPCVVASDFRYEVKVEHHCPLSDHLAIAPESVHPSE